MSARSCACSPVPEGGSVGDKRGFGVETNDNWHLTIAHECSMLRLVAGPGGTLELRRVAQAPGSMFNRIRPGGTADRQCAQHVTLSIVLNPLSLRDVCDRAGGRGLAPPGYYPSVPPGHGRKRGRNGDDSID